jgi:hypothetical protein
VVLDGDGSGLV